MVRARRNTLSIDRFVRVCCACAEAICVCVVPARLIHGVRCRAPGHERRWQVCLPAGFSDAPRAWPWAGATAERPRGSREVVGGASSARGAAGAVDSGVPPYISISK